MATCDSASLAASACANGYVAACQSEKLSDALLLQLLYQISGSSNTVPQLITSACTEGYLQAAQIPTQADALELQLLCQISGG